MNKCKKCKQEFEPSKGLINYCSLFCRNGKERGYETKLKISESNKKKVSEKERLQIIESYAKLKNLVEVGKLFGHSKTVIRRFVEIPKRYKKLTTGQSVVNWRKKAKLILIEYKGGCCFNCGYKKSIRSLTFHHLDPNKKDFNIGGKSWSLERLKIEVDKCILVCANCHGEIHDGLLILRPQVRTL